MAATSILENCFSSIIRKSLAQDIVVVWWCGGVVVWWCGGVVVVVVVVWWCGVSWLAHLAISIYLSIMRLQIKY